MPSSAFSVRHVALAALTIVALSLVAPARAAADAHAGRPLVLALIVTNNRSLGLARPDLRYADDDGAKYQALFRMLTDDDGAVLLTTMDRDTERLFPELRDRVRPPTKGELLAAAQRLADRARAASAAGRDVELYFVFAGHGDVDGGRGFVELADARFTSDDLESLLRSIPATRAHVILDSCNAFFVINARKPGGTRFPTAEDAARSLSERLPNVGVFLSTSAADEVFEWSELQSGIFSHAVRSGLSGAADANGDGAISYAELRAYVTLATSELKNPAHRPHVFARAPGGADSAALLDLRGADASVLEVGARGARRLTVRDGEELPWIDLNKEDAFAVRLRLPRHLAQAAAVDDDEAYGAHGRARRAVTFAAGATTTSLAALPMAAPDVAPRGPAEIFRALFAAPFGPRALAQFERDRAAQPPEPYGISSEDEQRMRLLLEQVSDSDRRQRIVGGTLLIGAGAALAGMGTGMVLGADHTVLDSPATARSIGWSSIATGAGLGVVGALVLTLPTSGERLYDDYREGLRLHPNDPYRVVADMDRRLAEMARADRRGRLITRWLSVGLAVVGATTLIVGQSEHTTPSGAVYTIYSGGLLVLASGGLFGQSFVPTARERVYSLWSQDPGLSHRVLAPTLSIVGGGGMFGLRGTF